MLNIGPIDIASRKFQVGVDGFSRVVRIAHDQPAHHVDLVAMEVVDSTDGGIAGVLTVLAGAILGAGAQELQIVLQNILDAQENVLEARAAHQGSQGLAVVGDGGSHALDEVLNVVQTSVDNRPAQRLKTVNVKGNVVVHHEDGLGAMPPRVADIGKYAVERV